MVCAERKAHSVLVSTLSVAVKNDPGYISTWGQNITGVRLEDVALHLLQGEPSQEYSSSGASSSRVQKLPDFYLESDPGFWTNLTKRISLAGLKPFKLHLYCNYEDGSENKHEVQGQRGRTISLPRWSSGYDCDRIATALKFCWSKLGPGISLDTVFDAVFEGGEIRTVDRKRLKELQKGSESPMEIIRDYIDCTEDLKKILKDFDNNFWEDFQLRRMEYGSGRIRWYCDEHFETAFKEEEWKD